MDQIAGLQDATASLLKRAQDSSIADLATGVEKATEVLRLTSDLERTESKSRKLALEESKLQYTIEIGRRSDKSGRIKDFTSLLTPLISILALAATVFLQSWQFGQSEIDKREAAEDAQWQNAVKTILQTSKVPAGVIALNPFLKSAKYGDQAKAQAVTLLATTDDKPLFLSLFGAAFVPVGWNNLDRVIQLDRALAARWAPLLTKASNSSSAAHGPNLNAQERISDDYLKYAVDQVSVQVGNVLKAPRPAGAIPDISATQFEFGDWNGADLNGANLDNMWLSWTDLNGADLDNVKQFSGAYFEHVAWWQAGKMSAELLHYLETDPSSRYNAEIKDYGSHANGSFSHKEYADDIKRLESRLH
jgi:hypothetical protein